MPLWIAIFGFFACACLGYGLACLCFVSSETSRREERAIDENIRVRDQQFLGFIARELGGNKWNGLVDRFDQWKKLDVAEVVASKFRKERNIPIEYEEAISLGMMGLMESTKNYKEEAGVFVEFVRKDEKLMKEFEEFEKFKDSSSTWKHRLSL